MRDIFELRIPGRELEALFHLRPPSGGTETDLREEPLGNGRVDGHRPVVPVVFRVVLGRDGRRNAQAIKHELHLAGKLLRRGSQSDGRGRIDPPIAFEEGRQEGPLRLMPRCTDAGGNFLARSRHVVKAVLLGKLLPDALARYRELFPVVIAYLDPKQPFHDPGELATHLGIPVGEPDGVVVRKRSLGHEIAQQDGLVLTEAITLRRLGGPEQRRDQGVSCLNPPCLTPDDEAALADHAQWMVVRNADRAAGP